MIQINYRDSRPIYEQIKDGIRKLIVQGIMQNNEKLPSVRELATSLTINPNTIQRAYRELEAEGYVYTVKGKGCFVAGIPEENSARKGLCCGGCSGRKHSEKKGAFKRNRRCFGGT